MSHTTSFLQKLHSKSMTISASFGLYCVHFHCTIECFMPGLVGVEDNQTMTEADSVFISFNVALCAYVLGCVCACVIG